MIDEPSKCFWWCLSADAKRMASHPSYRVRSGYVRALRLFVIFSYLVLMGSSAWWRRRRHRRRRRILNQVVPGGRFVGGRTLDNVRT